MSIKVIYQYPLNQSGALIMDIAADQLSSDDYKVIRYIDEGMDNRVVEVELTYEANAFIDGMLRMVDLMSPASDHVSDKPESVRKLQQLVFGNLKEVRPELEPFEEER